MAQQILGKETLVPLGVVVACSTGVFVVFLRAAMAMQAMQITQEQVVDAVQRNTEAVGDVDSAMQDMTERIVRLEQWIFTYQDLNPDGRFPRSDR